MNDEVLRMYKQDLVAAVQEAVAPLVAENKALAAELANRQQREQDTRLELAGSYRRIRELEAAINWVINDARYKAPEQIDAEMATRWMDRLRTCLTTETKTAPGFCPECLMTGGHKLRCSKAETACEHEWRSTQESYGEDADGNRGVMVTYEICTKCRARRDEL